MASVCSVCTRSIFVNAAGLIRLHGPVQNRCPGSRKPPASPGSHDLAIPPRVLGASSAASINLTSCSSANSSPSLFVRLPSIVTVKIFEMDSQGVKTLCQAEISRYPGGYCREE